MCYVTCYMLCAMCCVYFYLTKIIAKKQPRPALLRDGMFFCRYH